mmetsp:Transcript_21982/g.48601  ORF Transcript_21982/g.48601 Transcript_21982/m.48601 type:complete len:158 (+) Transcript_21982:58-531(+)
MGCTGSKAPAKGPAPEAGTDAPKTLLTEPVPAGKVLEQTGPGVPDAAQPVQEGIADAAKVADSSAEAVTSLEEAKATLPEAAVDAKIEEVKEARSALAGDVNSVDVTAPSTGAAAVVDAKAPEAPVVEATAQPREATSAWGGLCCPMAETANEIAVK